MNAMKKLKHEIAGMSDKTLFAMYSTFDMQKGWVSLCRGNFHVGIKTPEIIAAIMAAKAAANEAKANKKVVQK